MKVVNEDYIIKKRGESTAVQLCEKVWKHKINGHIIFFDAILTVINQSCTLVPAYMYYGERKS